MSNRRFNLPDGEARLADLAQRDGQRATPAFSYELHARIIRAVTRAALTPVDVAPPRGRAGARYWVAPLMLAASIALIAMATAVLRVGPSQIVAVQNVRPVTPLAPAHSEPPVAAIENAVHNANVRAQDLVQTAMAEQKWAGLDHDVRTATQYLVDQVPFRGAWESEPTGRER